MYYGFAAGMAGGATIVTTVVQTVTDGGPAAAWATPVLIGVAMFFGRKWVNGLSTRLGRIEETLQRETDATTTNARAIADMHGKLEHLVHVCPLINEEYE